MVGVKEVCTLEFADKFSVARLELKADTERERERIPQYLGNFNTCLLNNYLVRIFFLLTDRIFFKV
jgi:hypothetical protein